MHPHWCRLGGGSSDGATALLLLNRYWELQLSAAELQALAAQLGSDVAFCLQGGTQLCFGRGSGSNRSSGLLNRLCC